MLKPKPADPLSITFSLNHKTQHNRKNQSHISRNGFTSFFRRSAHFDRLSSISPKATIATSCVKHDVICIQNVSVSEQLANVHGTVPRPRGCAQMEEIQRAVWCPLTNGGLVAGTKRGRSCGPENRQHCYVNRFRLNTSGLSLIRLHTFTFLIIIN